MTLPDAGIVETLGEGFASTSLAIVGDLMMDHYFFGEVSRISPEAPVPVVRLVREERRPGGCGNVACNVVGLGARAALCGMIGPDPEGRELTETLRRAGIETTHVIEQPEWQTITKTRVIGGHQQILRLDREKQQAPAQAPGRLQSAVAAMIDSGVNGLILSDYAKGALSGETCRRIIELAHTRRVPVFVDPKGRQYEKYRGATALTPNTLELSVATGADPNDIEQLLRAGEEFRRKLEVKFLVVTRGEHGISLLSDEGRAHWPAEARDVFDVSGAGDTVIAVLAAGLSFGLDVCEAIRLANVAAGIVVGKVGTAPVRWDELREALLGKSPTDSCGKIVSLESCLRRVAEWRAHGETIVFTSGCFDLLHAGHADYLQRARRLGARLIVGLISDSSVRELKGPRRPINPETDRGYVLSSLGCVDAVVIQDDASPARLIEAIRPEIVASGDDALLEAIDGQALERWGGAVKLIPRGRYHSTASMVSRCAAAGVTQ
jgi:D-beta-D-heptose 7-phosphate kinase/D-beta-D-heptose 1-phosphate adenosyltransferase